MKNTDAQRHSRETLFFVSLCLCAFVFHPLLQLAAGAQRSVPTVNLSELPKEARQTIALIKKGGPFPYKRDGIVFGNFEKRLPLHERNYYKEFTVQTPGSRDRGARRVILGKDGELYYTDDHYKTFRLVRE